MEPHHCVFPVSDMVIHRLPQNRRALIVREEIHVKGVDTPISAVVHNDRATYGALGFSIAIWFDSGKPRGVRRHIIDRCQVDVRAAEIV